MSDHDEHVDTRTEVERLEQFIQASGARQDRMARELAEARADRDRLSAEVERLREALRDELEGRGIALAAPDPVSDQPPGVWDVMRSQGIDPATYVPPIVASSHTTPTAVPVSVLGRPAYVDRDGGHQGYLHRSLNVVGLDCESYDDEGGDPLCVRLAAELALPDRPAESDWEPDEEDTRTEAQRNCRNCDGRLCMSCCFREIHDECANDCPECCVTEPDTQDHDERAVDAAFAAYIAPMPGASDRDRWRAVVAAVRAAAPGTPHVYADCGDIACREPECLLALLEDARSYITPTISTHEEISSVLGWCDCGYCDHVPPTTDKES